MSKDMLGEVVRSLMGVPSETLGTLKDLNEKLAGTHGLEWLSSAKKFLRKENPFPPPIIAVDLLVSVEGASVEISPIRKKKTSGAFAPRNEDEMSPFSCCRMYLRLLDKETPTGRVTVQGYQLNKNMMFAEVVQAAGGLVAVNKKHLFTQHQIRQLVDAQSEGQEGPLLTDDRYKNFFFVHAVDGSVVVVYVYWCVIDSTWSWSVGSISLRYSGLQSRGDRVFLHTENLAA